MLLMCTKKYYKRKVLYVEPLPSLYSSDYPIATTSHILTQLGTY